MAKMSRADYAALYGPTTGDAIRLGDTSLLAEIEHDYAVYGGLEGRVTAISPDTMRDEVDPNTFYYRVFVQTTTDALVTAQGTRLPIVPGMVATVDVNTGSKSVLDYLIKPFNKAREALRER